MTKSGNVYVIGTFSGEVRFGGSRLTSEGRLDVFVASFNSGGNHRWSRQGGGSYDDYGIGIAVDSEHGVYATGAFAGTAGFGGDPLEAIAEPPDRPFPDIFLVSYDMRGAHRWSRQAGGPWAAHFGGAVAVSPEGEVVSTGDFYERVDFGGGELGSSEDAAFIATHDAMTGRHDSSLAIGGADGRAWGMAVATGPGLVCVGGYFHANVEVADQIVIGLGRDDGFIACFEP